MPGSLRLTALFVVGLCALLACTTSAAAVGYTWTGFSNSNWDAGANWSPTGSGFPGANNNDTAALPATSIANQPFLNVDATFDSLTIHTSSSVDWTINSLGKTFTLQNSATSLIVDGEGTANIFATVKPSGKIAINGERTVLNIGEGAASSRGGIDDLGAPSTFSITGQGTANVLGLALSNSNSQFGNDGSFTGVTRIGPNISFGTGKGKGKFQVGGGVFIVDMVTFGGDANVATTLTAGVLGGKLAANPGLGFGNVGSLIVPAGATLSPGDSLETTRTTANPTFGRAAVTGQHPDSVGTFYAVGNVTFNSGTTLTNGARLAIDINPASLQSDTFAIEGDLTLESAAVADGISRPVLDIADISLFGAPAASFGTTTFTIVTFTGARTGTLNNFDGMELQYHSSGFQFADAQGNQWVIRYLTNSIVLSPVPEPGAVALLSAAAAAMAGCMWRRRRSGR